MTREEILDAVHDALMCYGGEGVANVLVRDGGLYLDLTDDDGEHWTVTLAEATADPR